MLPAVSDLFSRGYEILYISIISMHLLLFSIQSIVFDCYAIQIRMLSLSLPELKKNFLLHRRWTMAAPGIVFSMDVAYWFPSYPETPFLLKK